jgi:hypothetical protein
MNIEDDLSKYRFREPGPYLEQAALAAAERGLAARRNSRRRSRTRSILQWAACVVLSCAAITTWVDDQLTRTALFPDHPPAFAHRETGRMSDRADDAPHGGAASLLFLTLRPQEEFATLITHEGILDES